MDLQIFSFPYLFCFIIFLLVFLKLFKKSHKNDSNPPPGPWKLTILGNTLQLVGAEFHIRLTELTKIYGPVMGIKVGQIPFLVVSSPETAKQVLKTQDPIFADRPLVLSGEILLYNRKDIFFAPHGDLWRQMRKFCALELLSNKRVQSFRPIREEEVANFVESLRLKKGNLVNLTQSLLALTNTVIARNVVGHKYKNQEKLLKIIEESFIISSGTSIADIFPSLKWLPSVKRERDRVWKVHRETDEILEDLLQEHRANRQGEADNLLDVLLDLQESGNLDVPLADATIKGTLIEMFGAGTDTSSKTVEWAMAELMRHPEYMKKAQEEVRSFFGENGYVDETKLQELKWLKLIIKETFRLHPPGAVIPRLCTERTKIDGYDVHPGTRVFVNVWAIGKDPKVWNKAEKFNPERFVDSPIDYRGNYFELLPFGAGKRICPGITLGMIHIEYFLANMLYHFNWKFPPGIDSQNLDMNECFGGAVKRKVDLQLIPIPVIP